MTTGTPRWRKSLASSTMGLWELGGPRPKRRTAPQ
jgi:hypothetical protein